MLRKKIVFIIGLTILLICSYIHLRNNRTVEMNIISQNFITVRTDTTLSENRTLSFDLEKKNVFSNYLAGAVKGSEFYYGYKHVSNGGEEEFKAIKKYLLYYPLIATKITQKQIKEANFKVRQSISPNNRKIIEYYSKNFARDKVIIEYNHDYLPVRMKLYDLRDKKWRVCAEYSYPYKNRKEYEKDLDECIEAILNGDFGED